MPTYKATDYAPFFGDELARSVELDKDGRDISHLVYVILPDIARTQSAIDGISRVRSKSQAHLGLSPEQYGARQTILLAARQVLVSERNKQIARLKDILLSP